MSFDDHARRAARAAREAGKSFAAPEFGLLERHRRRARTLLTVAGSGLLVLVVGGTGLFLAVRDDSVPSGGSFPPADIPPAATSTPDATVTILPATTTTQQPDVQAGPPVVTTLPPPTTRSPDQTAADNPALLDITQVNTGSGALRLFTEGAYSFIQVFDTNGALVGEDVFAGSVGATQIPVAPGSVRIVAFRRGCPGYCPGIDNLDVLDPPWISCEAEIDVDPGEMVRLVIEAQACDINKVSVPFATPRRCLPTEVTIKISSQEAGTGVTGISTAVTNQADEPCEVDTDIRLEVIGAGRTLSAEENPQTAQLGAYTLFPGHKIVIETEWKNSCGDYSSVIVQVDIANVGSADTYTSWPCGDIDKPGVLKPLYISGHSRPAQTGCEQVTAYATVVTRVSFPHATAKEALAATLGDPPEFLREEELGVLADLEPDDFVVIARTEQGTEYGHFADDFAAVVRARQNGGWGVDMVTISPC